MNAPGDTGGSAARRTTSSDLDRLPPAAISAVACERLARVGGIRGIGSSSVLSMLALRHELFVGGHVNE